MLNGDNRGAKLLVVDNDPKTLKVLEMRLKNEGYEIALAKNGKQALQVFSEFEPDLVLVDVNMPGVSGLEVLAEIKLKIPELPVIVMTAFSSEEVAVDAVKKGANDYVTKPFNSKEICQVIKENIERSRMLKSRGQLLEKLKTSSSDLISKVNELEGYNRELINSIRAKSEILEDLEDTNLKLKELSTRDSLTNLYNHAYFQERLSEEFKRCQRYNKCLSFIMIDIDDFKDLNDTYGHQAGDSILIKLSNLLMESIRGIDIAARYGGEEFALILPKINAEGAKLLAERLRQHVEVYFDDKKNLPQNMRGLLHKMKDIAAKVTISQGIATIPHAKIKTKADLIKAADNALYRAKRNGKNVVEVCD